jgi:hypothetical protein
MLIINLWTKISLVNSLIKTIYNISWDLNRNPTTDLPTRVFIRFNNYKGPDFLGYSLGVVPVFTITQ